MLALAELHEVSGRPSLAMEALAAAPGGGIADVPLPLLQRRAELLLRLGRPVRILSYSDLGRHALLCFSVCPDTHISLSYRAAAWATSRCRSAAPSRCCASAPRCARFYRTPCHAGQSHTCLWFLLCVVNVLTTLHHALFLLHDSPACDFAHVMSCVETTLATIPMTCTTSAAVK